MPAILNGLKSLSINSLFFTSVFLGAISFPEIWQPWQDRLINLPYLLLALVFLLAAQFNRSRFSWLSLVWMLIFFCLNQELPMTPWLTLDQPWLTVAVAWLITGLAFIKDRALLSTHSVNRLLLLVFCPLSAYGWHWASRYLISHPQALNLPSLLTASMPLHLPLLLAFLLLLGRCLWRGSLLHNALLISLTVWSGQRLNLVPLPWEISISLLACLYLLVIIIDSYFLAYRDELTGLPSRRALQNLALSLGRHYSVAMLDIDHFKKFNDTYGHDVGDQVLKLVASKLKQVQGGGRIFRYGGEEFTIVFPRKSEEDAAVELDDLRESIADYGMVIRQTQRQSKKDRGKGSKTRQKTVSVTVSIGVAGREARQSFDETVKKADQALYRAKKKGRNTVSY